jgi:hypothetical protein
MLKNSQNLMMKNKNSSMIQYIKTLQNHKKVNSYHSNKKKDQIFINCRKLKLKLLNFRKKKNF